MLGWTIRYAKSHRISVEYLEEMAAKGWMLRIYNSSVMIFKKCAPRQIRFAVDYMGKERHEFNENRKSPQVREYLALCEDSGWHFVDSNGFVYIFWSEDEQAVPMQTDAQTYLDSIYYRKKSRLIAMIILDVILAIRYGMPLLTNYAHLLPQENASLLYLIFGFVMTASIYEAMDFGIFILRERRVLEDGRLPEPYQKGIRSWIEPVIRAVIGIGACGVFLYWLGYRQWWILLILLAAVFVFSMVCVLIRHFTWNHCRYGHVLIGALLSATVWVGGMVQLFLWLPAPERETSGKNQVITDTTWEPVFTLEDLGREPHPEWVTQRFIGSSRAREYQYNEDYIAAYGEGVNYTVYVSDSNMAIYQIMHDVDETIYEKVKLDALTLGVDEAFYWQRYDMSPFVYWFRSGDYAIGVYPEGALTEVQIETVVECFLEWIKKNP